MPDSTPRPVRVFLVVAGLSDPAAEWTPLSDAGTPHLDRMAREGRVGVVHAPSWTPWEAFGRLLGFERPPALGACAAAGVDADPAPDEVVFRADWVTAAEDRILDPRAGDIDGVEADALLEDLARRLEGVRLVRLGGARNLAYLPRDAFDVDPYELRVAPPVCAMGRSLWDELPAGPLRALVETSLSRLPPHDVNAVRLDLGENPATALWPHGGGRLPDPSPPEPASNCWLPADAIVVGPGEEYAGLARWAGLRHVGSEAGDSSMVATALDSLEDGATLVLHARSVLEAVASGGADSKREAISYLDARVVGPLLGALEERDRFGFAVVGGGVVDGASRRWCHEDLPFAVASSELATGADTAASENGFSEAACVGSGLHLHRARDLAALLGF